MTIVLVVAVPAYRVSADNTQRVYRADDAVVESVRAVLLEQGLAPLFAAGPYSGAELLQNLDRVDTAALSPAGRARFAQIARNLEPPPTPEGVAFRASTEVSIESYRQTRPGETYWVYGHERRSPLLSVPLELWLHDSAYATLDLTVRRNYDSFDEYTTAADSGNLSSGTAGGAIDTPQPDPRSNIPSELGYIDPQFPFRSFMAVGGAYWSAQIGRETLSWGPGRSGTLIISDYADFHEGIRLSAFAHSFKYSYFWLNAPRFQLNGGGIRQRNYVGHRLDIRVSPRLNVALNEVYLIAKESMELRYLHPIMLYHNHFLPQPDSAIIAGVEVDYAIAPGWRVYGEFAFNSLMFAFLHGEWVDNDPDAFGVLIGADATFPHGDGHWNAGIEGVYTNPWFYTHRSSYTSLTHTRRVQSEHIRRRYVWVEKPLGYWAGPDFLGVFLTGGYERPSRFEVHGGVSVEGKGRRELFADTFDDYDAEHLGDISPSGENPQWRTVLDIEATLQPSSFVHNPALRDLTSPLELGTHVAAIWTHNRRRPGEPQEERPLEFDLQWTGRLTFRW